jgi:hypothetical protein
MIPAMWQNSIERGRFDVQMNLDVPACVCAVPCPGIRDSPWTTFVCLSAA